MLQEGLSYPTKGEEWIGRTTIGGLLAYFSVLFVPLLPYYGYQVKVLSSTAEGERTPPDFEGWLSLTFDGIKASVIAVLYIVLPNLVLGTVVFVLLLAIGGLGTADVANPEAVAGVGVVTLAVLGVVVAAVEFAILYLFPSALVNFAAEGSMRSAVSPRSVLGLAVSWQYLLAMLLPFVVGFVVVVLSSTIVGTVLAPAFVFWGSIAVTRMFGIAYREVHGIPVETPEPAGAGAPTTAGVGRPGQARAATEPESVPAGEPKPAGGPDPEPAGEPGAQRESGGEPERAGEPEPAGDADRTAGVEDPGEGGDPREDGLDAGKTTGGSSGGDAPDDPATAEGPAGSGEGEPAARGEATGTSETFRFSESGDPGESDGRGATDAPRTADAERPGGTGTPTADDGSVGAGDEDDDATGEAEPGDAVGADVDERGSEDAVAGEGRGSAEDGETGGDGGGSGDEAEDDEQQSEDAGNAEERGSEENGEGGTGDGPDDDPGGGPPRF